MSIPLEQYLLPRTRGQIASILLQAVETCVARGDLPDAVREAVAGADAVKVEIPANREHGDFASNLALALARIAGRSPRETAEKLARSIEQGLQNPQNASLDDRIALQSVEVAGPGFLNFRLETGWLARVVDEILALGERYGSSTTGNGESVLVEFVSANPTGPLNVVNSRAAAYGDALAALLDFGGYRVAREYYVNDQGNQFLQLGRAMETRLRQLLGEEAELPEGAYPGEYIMEIAGEYLDLHGSGVLEENETERLDRLARFAVERICSQQRATLEAYGVKFDRWHRESEVRSSGLPELVLEKLAASGMTYESEGALWLRTSQFGDDKDRVLIRQTGEYTYFLPDIAYHLGKFQRGFDRLIDLFGQDHHGYVPRLRAALAALGYLPDRLEVLITQMVRLVRNGEAVRMSKRGGNFITMDEFLEETGKDAARFFFLSRTLDSHMDFDLDLARLQSNENPVFYVQYAHARTAGILEQAAREGRRQNVPDLTGAAGRYLLVEKPECDLLLHLARWPEEVAEGAAAREPHRISHYLRELATLFHAFYAHCRVLGEDEAQTVARLSLVQACRQVFAGGLSLIGVTAPNRM